MPVIRAKQTKNFTQISNSALRKKELSLKARGLLAYMLSFSDEWDFSVSHIVRESGEREKSVRAALSELEAAGYVRHSPIRSEEGKFVTVRYDVFETPDLRAETVSDTSAETENTEQTEKHEQPKSLEKTEDTETEANSENGETPENAANSENGETPENEANSETGETPENAEIPEKTEASSSSPRDGSPYAEKPYAEKRHAVLRHAAKGGHKNTEYKRIPNKRTLSEKERRRSSTFDEIVAQVSDERLRSALREYLRMRFMIKRPPTDAALKKYIARVYELYPSSPELRVRCVEQSVINSRPNASRLPYDIEFPDKRHRSSKPRYAAENRLGSSFDNATASENGAPCSTSPHSASSDAVVRAEKETAATSSAEPPRTEPPSAEKPLPLTASYADALSAPCGAAENALSPTASYADALSAPRGATENVLPLTASDADALSAPCGAAENALPPMASYADALSAPCGAAENAIPLTASDADAPDGQPVSALTEISAFPLNELPDASDFGEKTAPSAPEPSAPPPFCASEPSEPPPFCALRRSRNAESMEISWQIILADLEDEG